MNYRNILLPLLLLPVIAGCAMVATTPEGEEVRVREADEVRSCRHVGTTSASVLADLAGIARHSRRVEREIDALARNSAAEMGGDTIVADGPIVDGRRNYKVYRCRP